MNLVFGYCFKRLGGYGVRRQAKSVVGVLFLILATGCRMPWVVICAGSAHGKRSIGDTCGDTGKFKLIVEWIQKKPLWVYRFWDSCDTILAAMYIFCRNAEIIPVWLLFESRLLSNNFLIRKSDLL